MAKRKKPSKSLATTTRALSSPAAPLLDDVWNLVRQARTATAQVVNSALVLLYWHVGSRIRGEILEQKRAAYGEQIVPTLSAQLAPEFGEGFSTQSLLGINMVQPYMHNGACESLACVVGDKDHRTANGTLPDVLDTAGKRAKVVRFLESIDANTTPFE